MLDMTGCVVPIHPFNHAMVSRINDALHRPCRTLRHGRFPLLRPTNPYVVRGEGFQSLSCSRTYPKDTKA